jgi:hypothetical protein
MKSCQPKKSLMVIDFNTNRIPQSESSQSATRRSDAPDVSDVASFSTAHSFNSQLSAAATVRPDKVAAAKDLVADGNYPSENDLSRIAGLLAAHLQSGSTSL